MERDLIRTLLQRYRRNLWILAIASVVVNLLVFAGSLYILLVYDSVLPGRSEPTLFGLFVMLVVIYVVQAVLEGIRSEALLSAANGIYRDLVEPVHRSAVAQSMKTQREGPALQLTRDLDQVHTFLAGTGPIAIVDLPWVPIFLVVLAALHWALGLTALVGAAILTGLTWLTTRRSAARTGDVAEITGRRLAATQSELRFAEAAHAMGMHERLLARAKAWDESFVENQSFLSRTVSRLGGAGRLFRLFLQSAMITVGALLVIDGDASGGIILAASVLTGRALAPVDQAIANSRSLSTARQGWRRIAEALAHFPQAQPRSVALAPPARELAVRDIWVIPPGGQTPVLSAVNLVLEEGQAVAVIGPSAAGKSTLVKAILGVWPPARGEVRIDGATFDQWDREALGRFFGYVPQDVELLEGTIAENISRFEQGASSHAIIAAAKAAGMHETILGFGQGYETPLGAGGPELSAGQRQRVALARALYGDPFIVVLDEPNSNLDAAGDVALATAIAGVRERGGIVVMVTHRPATLGPVSHVAMVSGGRLVDFGERDVVLQRNAAPKKETAQIHVTTKLERSVP